jgi:3'(2'), 5'-bisphosphate nucleotidase
LRRFNSDWCWIVDPLDGTKEFINKNGEFTVNIALAHKGRPVLGVISVPVAQTLYYGAVGIGSFKETDGQQAVRINVTDKTDKLILVGSRSHASDELTSLLEGKKDLISEVLSAGSSLKGTMVAEGAADVYYRFGYTCEWDTAAMHCIVEQAGGIFRQMDGSEMKYNRKDNLNKKGFYVVNRKENIWAGAS